MQQTKIQPLPLVDGGESSECEEEDEELDQAQGEENTQRHRQKVRGAIDEAELAEEISGVAEISLKEAMSSSNAGEWKDAIEDELQVIIQNNTWELGDRSRNRNVITRRIVSRNKFGP